MNDFWTSFWNFAWLFFWGFAFIAYLFAIFTVLTDLFRDRHLNGWGKAAWILFLIFVPFLTVLVYVIARGRGMIERLERDEQGNYGPTPTTASGPAASAQPSPAGQIDSAKQLLDAGVITAEEFERLKNRALAGRR